MAMVVPDVAEVEWLKRSLYGNAGSENLSLKIFQNNVTPSEGDTAGTYTEATFGGYSAMTLTSSQSGPTWAVPATVAGITSSTYGTNDVLTVSSPQTVYGYYCIFSTSLILALAEAFSTGPKSLINTDVLTITPKLQMD
jgi:hypothetical protein